MEQRADQEEVPWPVVVEYISWDRALRFSQQESQSASGPDARLDDAPVFLPVSLTMAYMKKICSEGIHAMVLAEYCFRRSVS